MKKTLCASFVLILVLTVVIVFVITLILHNNNYHGQPVHACLKIIGQ